MPRAARDRRLATSEYLARYLHVVVHSFFLMVVALWRPMKALPQDHLCTGSVVLVAAARHPC